MPQNLLTKDFETALQAGGLPMVLDFYADWCAPCRMQGPIFQQAEAALQGKASFYKVNIEEQPELAARFGVRSIPTIAVVHGGQEKWRSVGVTSAEEIAKAVNSLREG